MVSIRICTHRQIHTTLQDKRDTKLTVVTIPYPFIQSMASIALLSLL